MRVRRQMQGLQDSWGGEEQLSSRLEYILRQDYPIYPFLSLSLSLRKEEPEVGVKIGRFCLNKPRRPGPGP